VANQRKTFRSCLTRLLQTEFPGTFGPAVTRLFAEKIDDLYDRCHLLRNRVRTGQILWLAVAANERPGRSKRIEDTRLVPVVLDLVNREDIDEAIATSRRRDTRQKKGSSRPMVVEICSFFAVLCMHFQSFLLS
jgi:hypothetical protein